MATKLWARGFVPKSAAGTDLIPTCIGLPEQNPSSTQWLD